MSCIPLPEDEEDYVEDQEAYAEQPAEGDVFEEPAAESEAYTEESSDEPAVETDQQELQPENDPNGAR